MANITVAEVDVAIPAFWSSTALGALKANTVMAQLVRRDFDAVVASVGDTVNVTRRGVVSVNDKAANGTVTLQTPTASKIPIVLDQHKEVSFLVEDVASAKAIDDAVNYVEDAAIAIAEGVDLALLAMFDDCGAEVGDHSAVMSSGITVQTRVALNQMKCPQAGRYMVLGPNAEGAILLEEKFTSSDFGGDVSKVAIITANLGHKYGFDWFMDQQVVVDNTDDMHCLAFHRDAFVLVTRLLELPGAGTGAVGSAVSEDGVAMRAIRAYNPTYLGTQMTVDMLYGVKPLRADTHAVQVSVDDATA